MPQPIAFETPELQSNETFKAFADQDSLGKAYLELDGRVKAGGIDLLPEEVRKDPAVSVFKNVTELAKGYVETKKMVGTIEKAPAAATDYKFTPMTDLHPAIKPDNIDKSLAAVLHANGVGNKSADGIRQGILKTLSQNAAAAEQVRKDTALKNETELRGAWGDKYDQNFDLVHKTLLKAAGKDAATAVEETAALAQALKGAPVLLKSLNKIFSSLSEDSIGKLGDEGGQQTITDKTKAQARINEIILMRPNPMMDEKHPQHKEVSAEWKSLQDIIGKEG